MSSALRVPFDSDIRKFPSYEKAVPWPRVVEAASLTPASFRQAMADQCPLLIKGAVRHWPAFSRWNVDDLRRRIGSYEVVVRTAPALEFDDDSDYNRATTRRMSFGEFLDLTTSCESHLAIHSWHLDPPQSAAAKILADDVGGFPWISRARTWAYPAKRVFFYQNSYTDWHHHVADETIMTQVMGTKEVLLLPPDRRTARALRPLYAQQGHCTNVRGDARAALAEVIPYRVVVEPGDGLYIPVYWWHAVADARKQLGATVAVCWSSALSVVGDLRMEPARNVIASTLRTRYAPLFAFAIGWSLLSRVPWRPAFAVPNRPTR
jgi:hypothetical protein